MSPKSEGIELTAPLKLATQFGHDNPDAGRAELEEFFANKDPDTKGYYHQRSTHCRDRIATLLAEAPGIAAQHPDPLEWPVHAVDPHPFPPTLPARRKN